MALILPANLAGFSRTEILDEFTLNLLQERWASKRRQGVPASVLKRTLVGQKGFCALSRAPMVFDVSERTPQKGGPGCHPLCPAVDHIDPGNPTGGIQIVCYALNDLKGHLPLDCFKALRRCKSWKLLMLRWRRQAEKEPKDRAALTRLLRPNAKPRKQKSTRATLAPQHTLQKSRN